MIKPKDYSISTPLGHQIGISIFHPKLSNNKSIIISSATGVLQRFYFQFASHFSELGYTVYTFDYSGIGKLGSNIKNLKQNKIDLVGWGKNDQASIIDYVKTKNPNHKIVLIAHSIGGQIIAFNLSST